MDFIWNSITDWLKEVLVSGIVSNLSGMFDSTNEQIGQIAGQVGLTPQAWNSGIFNIFENSDFIYMLNQAAGDRKILAQQLGISPHQLSYVTHSNAGEGLLFYGDTIVPFVDNFPKDTELYRLMTTRPSDKKEDTEE